jgi:hypothetical protein
VFFVIARQKYNTFSSWIVGLLRKLFPDNFRSRNSVAFELLNFAFATGLLYKTETNYLDFELKSFYKLLLGYVLCDNASGIDRENSRIRRKC